RSMTAGALPKTSYWNRTRGSLGSFCPTWNVNRKDPGVYDSCSLYVILAPPSPVVVSRYHCTPWLFTGEHHLGERGSKMAPRANSGRATFAGHHQPSNWCRNPPLPPGKHPTSRGPGPASDRPARPPFDLRGVSRAPTPGPAAEMPAATPV